MEALWRSTWPFAGRILQHCRGLPGVSSESAAHTRPQGTYAKVKYGQHVETGEAVAIKARRQGGCHCRRPPPVLRPAQLPLPSRRCC